MGYVVRVPGLGMQEDEAELAEWAVAPGDAVEAGALVAVLETQKAAVEVEASDGGVLRRRFATVGETVNPGDPIGIVADADADLSALEADLEVSVEADDDTAPSDSDGGDGTGGVSAGASDADSSARVSPRARRRAEELDVNPDAVDGSGPGGAVVVNDVEAAHGDRPGPRVREERELEGARRTTADRLSRSADEAVHVTLHRTVDAEALTEAADASSHELDASVGTTDVLLMALSASLRSHPAFNATFEDGIHRLYETQNVGVAVDAEEGLFTPVVSDLESLSLAEVAAERRRLVETVREGSVSPAELEGGTFTVSNLGPMGVESFDPVIDPPQVAILGVSAVAPAVVPEDGRPAVRRQVPLDLSFDHRVVDGAGAARFLETLAGHLTDPWPLLDAVDPPPDADGYSSS